MQKYGTITKEKMLKEMTDKISQNKFLFIANFEKLSVMKVEGLRKSLITASSGYMVVKNSLTRIALKNAKIEQLSEGLVGISGIVYTNSDPVAISKILTNFAKDNKTFRVSSAIIEGRILNVNQIKELSQLPSREVLLAQVVCAINSPIYGFVIVLGGVTRNFVYVLEAIRKKKEKEPKAETIKVEPSVAANDNADTSAQGSAG